MTVKGFGTPNEDTLIHISNHGREPFIAGRDPALPATPFVTYPLAQKLHPETGDINAEAFSSDVLPERAENPVSLSRTGAGSVLTLSVKEDEKDLELFTSFLNIFNGKEGGWIGTTFKEQLARCLNLAPPSFSLPALQAFELDETGPCYPPPHLDTHDLSVKSTKEGDYHQQLHKIEINAFSSYIHHYKDIIQGMEVMIRKFERIKNELNKEKQKKDRNSYDYAKMEKVFEKLEKFNALSELMQACTWFYFTNNNEFLYRWCLDVANGFLALQRQFGVFSHEAATLAHPSNMLCREEDFMFSRVDGVMGLLGHDKYLLDAKRTELDLIAKMNDIIDYLKTCNDPALNKLELYSKNEITELTNNKNLQRINNFKEREQDTFFGNIQTGRFTRLATYAHDLSTMQNIIREYSKATRAVYNVSENIEMYNR